MNYVKKSISIPEETLTQIEALRECWSYGKYVSFSAMIAACVQDAYWHNCKDNDVKQLLSGTTSHGGTPDPVFDDNGFLTKNNEK